GTSPTMTGTSPTMTGTSPTMTGTSPTMTGTSPTMTGTSPTMTGTGPDISITPVPRPTLTVPTPPPQPLLVDGLVVANDGSNYLIGSLFNDTISGGGGDDTLLSRDGDDLLRGEDGNDSLNGGAGKDIVEGGRGNDTARGGKGDDLVSGDQGDDVAFGDQGNDLVLGSEGNDTLYGGKGNDCLRGGGEDDLIFGDKGNDSVFGDTGNDCLIGGAGNDILLGAEGGDVITGGVGNDTGDGGEGDDLIFGGDGNDSLSGDAGDDILSGDRGSDTLTGGDGSDIFVLGRVGTSPASNGFLTTGGREIGDADVIRDFNAGDLIGLAGGLNFTELEIFQGQGSNSSNTIIRDRRTGEFLAVLIDVRSNSLDESRFTTGQIPRVDDNPFTIEGTTTSPTTGTTTSPTTGTTTGTTTSPTTGTTTSPTTGTTTSPTTGTTTSPTTGTTTSPTTGTTPSKTNGTTTSPTTGTTTSPTTGTTTPTPATTTPTPATTTPTPATTTPTPATTTPTPATTTPTPATTTPTPATTTPTPATTTPTPAGTTTSPTTGTTTSPTTGTLPTQLPSPSPSPTPTAGGTTPSPSPSIVPTPTAAPPTPPPLGGGPTPPSFTSPTPNQPPIVEAGKTLTGLQNLPLSLSISAPSDPEGQPLAIAVVGLPNPTFGQVITGTSPIAVNQKLTVQDLLGLKFQPGTNVIGQAGSFSYSVADDQGGTAAASVAININSFDTSVTVPTILSPIAVNDGIVFTNTNNLLPTFIDVLANDSSPQKGTLSIINVSTPQLGIAVNLVSQVQFIPGNVAGTTAFTYSVSDGFGTIPGVGTVTVQILPADSGPNNLVGGSLPDNLDGLAGSDTIDGQGGNDTINGGLDNDVLVGGLGADTMTGGGGSNQFRYTSPAQGGPAFDAASSAALDAAIAAGGYDVITDFNGLGVPIADQFNFAPGFPNLSGNTQVLLNVQTTVSANILGGTAFLFAYDSGGNTYIIYDGNGNNVTGADSRILAKLNGVTGVSSLSGFDFTFI
ncbi:Ig-like domain-containing protein, partial [Microcoleus sp. Pol11C3]|uniref:Ig-like domain-containing protein n=1 Tax=Microcoleus sp. Pol11C3 TaxID=3055390 RepID=UPI0040407DA0